MRIISSLLERDAERGVLHFERLLLIAAARAVNRLGRHRVATVGRYVSMRLGRVARRSRRQHRRHAAVVRRSVTVIARLVLFGTAAAVLARVTTRSLKPLPERIKLAITKRVLQKNKSSVCRLIKAISRKNVQ